MKSTNMNYYIIHDNGVPGQRGMSDGYTETDIDRTLAEYIMAGITVYEIGTY